MSSATVDAIVAALRAARRLCVLTGAGMSAESGVETFRDAGGLWSKFDPDELATPEAFRRDPVKVWAWYRARRAQLRAVEPHEGHRVLARWESRIPDYTLVTQNVDGLHQRAGSRRIVCLHGRLDVARCTACLGQVVGLDDLGEDPRCAACGARLRPAVVWFNELLPPDALGAASAAAARCDVMLVVGTSGVVQPAAALPLDARAHGATVVEINPNATAISGDATICFRTTSRDGLSAIDAAWD
ncbi:MAG: NAD-dependent deacetylase [Phycisphaerae bacterium]